MSINLEREIILRRANEVYETMQSNKKEWKKDKKELDLWESTLEDGFQDDDSK